MQFDKSKVQNIQSTHGRGKSKWDGLAEILVNPGDRYTFDPSEVSSASCAQGAARLRKITGKPFHSGVDAIDKVNYIRLRTDEEVANKEDAGDEEE